jgi:hypothetical protein
MSRASRKALSECESITRVISSYCILYWRSFFTSFFDTSVSLIVPKSSRRRGEDFDFCLWRVIDERWCDYVERREERSIVIHFGYFGGLLLCHFVTLISSYHVRRFFAKNFTCHMYFLVQKKFCFFLSSPYNPHAFLVKVHIYILLVSCFNSRDTNP